VGDAGILPFGHDAMAPERSVEPSTRSMRPSCLRRSARAGWWSAFGTGEARPSLIERRGRLGCGVAGRVTC